VKSAVFEVKPMPRKVKLGERGGVRDWQALDSAGDVKRFLRWVILSARSQTMTTSQAAVFGQLALAMLRTMETSDLEARLEQLERNLALQQQAPLRNGVHHANH
jgi:hypothetical protein